MRPWHSFLAVLLIACVCRAGEADNGDKAIAADAFIHQVVQSLIDDQHAITFEIADSVFAMDNGEVLSKAQFEKGWPELGKQAFKTKVSVDQFFRDVTVKVISPLENKRLMSNKRLMKVYTPDEHELYCDASQVRSGVENFIGYEKAFVFIIRKIQDKWTLIGIGG